MLLDFVLQRAQTAFAANEYGTARYWFELIRTWSPESAAAPLAACEAYCAAEVSTDRADACETLPTTSLLPSVGSEQIAASPVRFRVVTGQLNTLKCTYVAGNIALANERTAAHVCRRKGH